jgi:hypothetical protein
VYPRFHLLLILLTCCGCHNGRPSLVQATGSVKLNGQPLAGATVAFEPAGGQPQGFHRPSNAVTDAQGNFRMGTYQAGDGIPPGKYKVTVIKREVVGELPKNYNSEIPGSFNVKFQWTTPREYADASTSRLEAEATRSGLKPQVFDIKREGPPEIESTNSPATTGGANFP